MELLIKLMQLIKSSPAKTFTLLKSIQSYLILCAISALVLKMNFFLIKNSSNVETFRGQQIVKLERSLIHLILWKTNDVIL